MPMRIIGCSASPLKMRARYDTSKSSFRVAAPCEAKEPNARVAATREAQYAARHSIRRRGREERDTACRQSSADYGRRHGDWASDRVGVRARGRRRGGGGTKAG